MMNYHPKFTEPGMGVEIFTAVTALDCGYNTTILANYQQCFRGICYLHFVHPEDGSSTSLQNGGR
jgi:hypothetical protein